MIYSSVKYTQFDIFNDLFYKYTLLYVCLTVCVIMKYSLNEIAQQKDEASMHSCVWTSFVRWIQDIGNFMNFVAFESTYKVFNQKNVEIVDNLPDSLKYLESNFEIS